MSRDNGSTARPVALVTGASAGIGWTFAEKIAAAGYDVVLVARRRDQLDELARQIKASTSAAAYPIACDLSTEDGPRQLYDEVKARGLHISLLVNNAGYSIEGDYLGAPWDSHRACTRLLTITPAELIHYFLPDMLERGEGRILNVSSLGAVLPCVPKMTTYVAAKKHMIMLTRTLAAEYRGSGVTFSVVLPFSTRTAFLDGAITKSVVAMFPGFLIQEPEDVVDAALKGLDKGHVVQHTSLLNRALAPLMAIAPPRLVGWSFAQLEKRMPKVSA